MYTRTWLNDCCSLTEDQLEPLVDRSESLQEYYELSKDERYQGALDALKEIGEELIDPPAGFHTAFTTAAKKVENLREKLENHPDARQSLARDRVLLCVTGFERDIGQPLSRQAFPAIRKKADAVLEEWRQQGALLQLAHAILARGELARLKYLDNPTQRAFATADGFLNAVGHVSKMAIDRCTGEQKNTALFLRWYGVLGEFRLVSDAGEKDQTSSIMQVLQQRANDVNESYGTGPVIETVEFLTSITQAEYYLKHNQLMEAEDLLSAVQSCSIEEDINIAYIKAGLALAEGGDGDHEDVQKFIQLLHHYPFLTYHNQLQELKATYPKIVPAASLLKGNDVFVETMSMFGHTRHIHPYVLSV